MADQSKPLTYYGASEVPATYADNFAIANNDNKTSFSLYFYQAPIPDFEGDQPQRFERVPQRCVARIVLTPRGMDRLLRSIAKERDATVNFSSPESSDTET
jgi:hypothetical protein